MSARISRNYLGEEELPSNLFIIAQIDSGWGYKKFATFSPNSKNKSEVFRKMLRNNSHQEWYTNGRDLYAVDHHHDGTNIYLYRLVRHNAHINKLIRDIYADVDDWDERVRYYTSPVYPTLKEYF